MLEDSNLKFMSDKNWIRLTLRVEGMHCGMCESHVNDVVRRVPGVKKVDSSHTKQQTVVVLETSADREAIKEAITKQGYRVFSEKEEPYVQKGFFSFLRKK